MDRSTTLNRSGFRSLAIVAYLIFGDHSAARNELVLPTIIDFSFRVGLVGRFFPPSLASGIGSEPFHKMPGLGMRYHASTSSADGLAIGLGLSNRPTAPLR